MEASNLKLIFMILLCIPMLVLCIVFWVSLKKSEVKRNKMDLVPKEPVISKAEQANLLRRQRFEEEYRARHREDYR